MQRLNGSGANGFCRLENARRKDRIQVMRVKNTNELEYLVVKGWLRSEYRVKPGQISSIAKSIILKGGVDVPKRSFWK